MAYVIDPVDDYSTRISVLLTLILTLIAFTFTIQGSLPNEPYLSLIEKYTILSILVLFLTVAWTSIVKAMDYKYDKDWRSGDDVVAVIQLIVLVVAHALIVIKCILTRRREISVFRNGLAITTKPQKNIQVSTTRTKRDDDATAVYSS